jgi:6-phosphogluconolactonase
MPVRIFESADQVAEAAAESFAWRAQQAIGSSQEFNVALSGGSTPVRLFKLLAGASYRGRIHWDGVHFFWGDERTVPPDHPDSNFGATGEALLSKLEIPRQNVHRIQAELGDPEEAAALYEAELRRHFGLAEGEFPRFDLAFLGMGADGHTASLFPGTGATEERRRLVIALWVEKLDAHRITLTCPVFNNAACIVFVVTGREKAETLREVVEGAAEPTPPPRYPAQLIRPESGEVHWYVDRAAGHLLNRKP